MKPFHPFLPLHPLQPGAMRGDNRPQGDSLTAGQGRSVTAAGLKKRFSSSKFTRAGGKVGYLHSLAPDAHFPHIVRDPRRVVVSYLFEKRYRLIRHEELASEPGRVLADVYGGLGLELPKKVNRWAAKNLRPASPVFRQKDSRWRESYDRVDLTPILNETGYTIS